MTSNYIATRELNKINVFLRKLCTSRLMFGRFESYVAKVLFSIPLPSRQNPITLNLHLPKLDVSREKEETEILTLSLPGSGEMPKVNNEAISCLFNCLGIKTILRCIKYMLLEERLVFIGNNRNDIVNCCEALRSLIFPFNYDHGGNWYISYISLRDYSQSEWSFPAMIGLDKKLLKVAEVQEMTTWVIDLDSDILWKTRHRLI